MERLVLLTLTTLTLAVLVRASPSSEKSQTTILSTILTPDTQEKTLKKQTDKEKALSRQGRSYYYPGYGVRPLYERLEYGRPEYDRPRCGRCFDDRYDDRDDYDRPNRDRYDDDRRHRPTYGNRYDRNRNDNEEEDDRDRRYNTDRNKSNKNGTDDQNDDDKRRPDDKDNRPSGSGRDRHRNRYDDRDRYRPDYYDRFLKRDPYRGYDRGYYDDGYRERRPLYDRYPSGYDDPYAGRYDGYPGVRRPAYDDRYDRGGVAPLPYDDGYGGYGPGVGRGPHDRPWDETYRGQAGWDAGGRGYYFASGRPDAAPAAAWGRPEYARPEPPTTGYQSGGFGNGYSLGGAGYRDPVQYQGTVGYNDGGYRQDVAAGYGQSGYGQSGYGQSGYGQSGYGQSSGWQNVGRPYRDQRDEIFYRGSLGFGESGTSYRQALFSAYGPASYFGGDRPYRDQSGVNKLDDRDRDRQPSRSDNRYASSNRQPSYSQSTYGQSNGQTYGQPNGQTYGQPNGQTYGQSNGQSNSYGQSNYGQSTYQSTSGLTSSTTPQTSYLYQREDEQVTTKSDETTKTPS